MEFLYEFWRNPGENPCWSFRRSSCTNPRKNLWRNTGRNLWKNPGMNGRNPLKSSWGIADTASEIFPGISLGFLPRFLLWILSEFQEISKIFFSEFPSPLEILLKLLIFLGMTFSLEQNLLLSLMTFGIIVRFISQISHKTSL